MHLVIWSSLTRIFDAADAASVLVIKQLRCLRACLLEAAATGLLAPPESAAQASSSSDGAASGGAANGSPAAPAASGNNAGGGDSADSTGSGGGSSLGSLLTGGGTYDEDGLLPEANRAAASAFLDATLAALPALARIKTQTVQEEAAK